jgi:hypothetical protein
MTGLAKGHARLDYGGVLFDRFPAAVRALAARCKLPFAYPRAIGATAYQQPRDAPNKY